MSERSKVVYVLTKEEFYEQCRKCCSDQYLARLRQEFPYLSPEAVAFAVIRDLVQEVVD